MELKSYLNLSKRDINIDHEIISNDAKEVSKEIFNKINDKKNKKVLSGIEAFILYDTYGFPIEITSEICSEFGLEIDSESFDEIMNKQKDNSKKSSSNKDISEKIYSKLNLDPTEFLGFETLTTKSKVLAIFQNIT